MKNEINIMITSDPGLGKSTIAQQIAGQLQMLGFDVNLEFINNEHEPREIYRHFDMLEAIRQNGTVINVKEELTSRKKYLD